MGRYTHQIPLATAWRDQPHTLAGNGRGGRRVVPVGAIGGGGQAFPSLAYSPLSVFRLAFDGDDSDFAGYREGAVAPLGSAEIGMALSEWVVTV